MEWIEIQLGGARIAGTPFLIAHGKHGTTVARHHANIDEPLYVA
jgi:hypothetical protein